MKKLLNRALAWAGAALVLALVVATGSQWLLSHLALERNPPPVEMVVVSGRGMHLIRQGQGSPVIVLESGIADRLVPPRHLGQSLLPPRRDHRNDSGRDAGQCSLLDERGIVAIRLRGARSCLKSVRGTVAEICIAQRPFGKSGGARYGALLSLERCAVAGCWRSFVDRIARCCQANGRGRLRSPDAAALAYGPDPRMMLERGSPSA